MVDFENIFNNLALIFSFLSLLIQPSFFVWKMTMLGWTRYKSILEILVLRVLRLILDTDKFYFIPVFCYILAKRLKEHGKRSNSRERQRPGCWTFWSECVFWRVFWGKWGSFFVTTNIFRNSPCEHSADKGPNCRNPRKTRWRQVTFVHAISLRWHN